MDLVVCVLCLLWGGEIFVGQFFIIIFGGKGVNQVVVVVCFGVGVVMIGCFGDDVYGDQLYCVLQVEGIDCQGVEWVVGEFSGVVLIVVDDSSQNVIVIVVGGNGYLLLVVLVCYEYLLEQVQVVVCQLESLLEMVGYVLCWVYVLGKMVIFNLVLVICDVLVDWLLLVDYLVFNEIESELFCCLLVDFLESVGCVVECLCEMGVGRVIVIFGVQGVLLVGEGWVEYFLVVWVKVLDIMVVGDIFVGGFVVVFVCGFDEVVVICFGQVVVVILVICFGVQILIFLCEEVEWVFVGEV